MFVNNLKALGSWVRRVFASKASTLVAQLLIALLLYTIAVQALAKLAFQR